MRKRKQKVFLILTILWMAVIFVFSSRDADQSTEDSHLIGLWIGHTFVPEFDNWQEAQQYAYAESIDYPVRKTAHAGEYLVLAIFMTGLLTSTQASGRRYLMSWIFTVMYAATDEYHQLFVPGRSGQPTDVCIDAVGALIGIVIVYRLSAGRNREK